MLENTKMFLLKYGKHKNVFAESWKTQKFFAESWKTQKCFC
jgi:hypothetical protein